MMRYLDNPNCQLYRPSVNSEGTADSFGNRWDNRPNNNNAGQGPGNPGNNSAGGGSSRGFSSFSGTGRTFS